MPDVASRPPGTRWVFALLALAIVGTIAFWIVWFFVDRNWLASAHTPEYYAFENSFPLADGWLVLCASLAAWALVKRRPSALLWLLLTASASVYLGAMDVLFDLENGIYRASGSDWGSVITEILINVFTLAGGAFVARHAWKNRAALLGGAAA